MSLLDPLKDVHNQVAHGIRTGVPGLAQIRFGLQPVSLVRENGHTKIWGVLPDKMTIEEVRGAIIDDLVDDTTDSGAMASRKDMFTKQDFLDRARYYENRYSIPTLKDQRFAEAIRAYAERWLN